MYEWHSQYATGNAACLPLYTPFGLLICVIFVLARNFLPKNFEVMFKPAKLERPAMRVAQASLRSYSGGKSRPLYTIYRISSRNTAELALLREIGLALRFARRFVQHEAACANSSAVYIPNWGNASTPRPSVVPPESAGTWSVWTPLEHSRLT